MKKLILVMSIMLTLASCTQKSTTQTWMDSSGDEVPVKVAQKNNTTVYNFGTIILKPDTIINDTLK